MLDNSIDLFQNISKANKSVKLYLKSEYQRLLKNKNLIEGIETALPYSSDDKRTEIIENLIRGIAKIV